VCWFYTPQLKIRLRRRSNTFENWYLKTVKQDGVNFCVSNNVFLFIAHSITLSPTTVRGEPKLLKVYARSGNQHSQCCKSSLHSRLSIQLTPLNGCLPLFILHEELTIRSHIQLSVSHHWDYQSPNGRWWKDVIDYSSQMMTKASCQKHWIFIVVENSIFGNSITSQFASV